MKPHTKLGPWIKQQRKLLDLTQEDLSRRVGYALSTVRKIESGVLRPSREVAERLADEQQGARACFRVAVPSPGGAFTFWVDQEDFLLRRLDYPAAALAPDLARGRV